MNFSTFRRMCSLFLFAFIFIVVGCENGEPSLEIEETVQESEEKSEVQSSETSNETNSISIFAAMDPGQFDEVVRKPLNEAFPEITFELIPGRRTEEMLGNWETTKPDMVLDFVNRLSLYEDADVLADLEPLVRKHSFELEQFNENLIPQSSEGLLLGLPYNVTSYGIIYNQSIFDHFQVDTPLDGMTWEEIIELSKKVTGEIDGGRVQGNAMVDRFVRSLYVGDKRKYACMEGYHSCASRFVCEYARRSNRS